MSTHSLAGDELLATLASRFGAPRLGGGVAEARVGSPRRKQSYSCGSCARDEGLAIHSLGLRSGGDQLQPTSHSADEAQGEETDHVLY